ncbi:hypothetical protein [Bordetella sp. 2513F-2]
MSILLPRWPVRLACVLAGLLMNAATAAAPTDVASGDSVILASYYELGPGCVALRPPRLRITQPPELGQAIVMGSHAVVQASPGCAPMRVPVVQVLYQAGRPGLDMVSWEVRSQRRDRKPAETSAQVRVTPRR